MTILANYCPAGGPHAFVVVAAERMNNEPGGARCDECGASPKPADYEVQL